MNVSLKSFSIRFLRGILLVVLFMGMAGIGTYLTLTLMIKSEDTVIVPNLVGKDVLVGLEMLSDLGLNTRVKGTRYDDQVPQHYVIEQSPEPGSAIKRGRDVKIQVSRGPESVVMPNLAGLSFQQSKIVLTENGLCQGVVSRMHSPLHPVGQVIAHFPPPSSMVSRKKCVDLLVSQESYPFSTAMTDLKGFTLEMAIRRLEQLQLNTGHIRSVINDEAPPETIVAQTPMAGYRVTVGSLVDLQVNRMPTSPTIGNPPSANGMGLYHFSLDNGFLNRRVQVKLNQALFSINLFDDFLRPGQEIWLLIPKSGNPTVLIYVDGQLVDSQIMDGR
ncbi:PASTA-domain protein [Desulfosarcina variabilis str. Montpellier]|uniref:PASTA domain-containing protein n=1 Tax=Desulfosarcina variabilis TaxID=2300 RepID=UPI003AFAC980